MDRILSQEVKMLLESSISKIQSKQGNKQQQKKTTTIIFLQAPSENEIVKLGGLAQSKVFCGVLVT